LATVIQVEALTAERFAVYGQVVTLPHTPAPKTGDGWDCWNYIAMMDVTVPIGMGLVVTRERGCRVDVMERHVSREELLLPFDKEIIQPVARCLDIDDPDEMPDAATVRCFRIRAGQAIIIGKGVWHSAAYPVNEDATYLFAIEKKADKFGDEMVNPWVAFRGRESVEFELPG
jgi:ureidoglycolate lyase